MSDTGHTSHGTCTHTSNAFTAMMKRARKSKEETRKRNEISTEHKDLLKSHMFTVRRANVKGYGGFQVLDWGQAEGMTKVQIRDKAQRCHENKELCVNQMQSFKWTGTCFDLHPREYKFQRHISLQFQRVGKVAFRISPSSSDTNASPEPCTFRIDVNKRVIMRGFTVWSEDNGRLKYALFLPDHEHACTATSVYMSPSI